MNTTISRNQTKTAKQTNLPVNSAVLAASSLHTGSHITPTYLNIYDLGGCSNSCIHSIGLSFYHCAVQTHSAEYGYMGHPYQFTGLYKTSKHDSRFHLYRLRHSIEIGWTWFNEKEIDQTVHDLEPFYLGLDYHTTNKNSIHFAKYLLEQLSNDPQLKHLEPIKLIQFPSYVDRGRRLSQTFEFLQIFDTEKDLAEINILYFVYMKYQGNLQQICQTLKCDTIDKFKRSIKLIEQGIEQNKLPLFSSLNRFDMKTAYDCLSKQKNSDVLSNNEQLTLTDIFHQFDTITLRGRTSIDRYLNIQPVHQSQTENEKQLTIELPQIGNTSEENQYQTSSIKHNVEYPTLSHIPRSSQPQSISQNQERTPLTSPSGSNISGLALTSNSSPTLIFLNPSKRFEHFHVRALQETSTPNVLLPELGLITNIGRNPFSLINNRERKLLSSPRKRKLPRDLELTKNLYTINNQNLLRQNYTNNAIPSFSQSHHDTDSSV